MSRGEELSLDEKEAADLMTRLGIAREDLVVVADADLLKVRSNRM